MTTPNGYGEQSSNTSGLPGYGAEPGAPQYNYSTPGVALEQGNRKARALASLRQGFTQFTRSVGSWVAFTFTTVTVELIVFVVANLIVGMLNGSFGGNLANQQPKLPLYIWLGNLVGSIILTSIVFLYGFNGGLQAAEGRKLSLGKFFVLKCSFGKGFAACCMLTFLNSLPQIVSYFLPNRAGVVPGQEINFADLISPAVVASGVGSFIMLFLYPLFAFAPMYVIDRGMGIGDAFATAFADGARNYLPILGILILTFIIMALSSIPLGLGLLVTIPVSFIMSALIYRSMSGGLHVFLDD